MVLFLAGELWALTWQEALSQAANKSNEIQGARKQLEAYQWTYYKSYSNFLPQVSAGLSQGESTGGSGTSTSYSYGLNATQSLFKGLSNYYNLRSAAVNYDYYRANLQNTEADAYYQLRLAFIDLYVAQQNVAVRERILKSRAENERMIKLFYDSGTEDKGNYLRTQAQLNEAEYNVASAKRSLELARLKLAQLLDSSITSAEGSPAVVAVLLPDLDSLIDKSPVYLLAKYQLESADINQQKTLSGFLPSVSLNGSYQKSGSDWPPASSSKSWSLSISLPLFPGGSNFIDRVIYGLQLEKAREDFAKNQKDLYYTIKEAYESLKDAIEAYSVQKTYLAASSERAKIAQSKYLNGLISYNDWDLIQNEYINNQNTLLNYNKNALVAEASWYKSYGGYIK